MNPTTDTTTGNQFSLSNEDKDGIDLRIRKRDKGRKIVIYVESESESEDNENIPLNFTGGTQQIQRYAQEVLYHRRTKIELKANGAILITPHPRPLPAELLSLILKQVKGQTDLYACALVNKEFHSLVNPMLWKEPKILHRKALRLFLTCLADAQHPTVGRHIQTLDMAGDYWTDTKLSLLLPHIRQLKELTIQTTTRITHTSFNHLPRYCPELAVITFEDHKPLTEQTILRMTQHCHKLRTLSMKICPRISDDTFAALGNCPLENFLCGFADADFFTTQMAHEIAKWDLRQLLLPNIPDHAARLLLTLRPTQNDARGSSSTTETTTKTTSAGTYCWPRLHRLNLSNCCAVDDATFIPFMLSHPRLLHISLTGGSSFTDVSVDSMVKSLPHLMALHLNANPFISSSAIRKLVCSCTKLTLLILTECALISAGDFPEANEHPVGTVQLTRKGLETIRRSQ